MTEQARPSEFVDKGGSSDVNNLTVEVADTRDLVERVIQNSDPSRELLSILQEYENRPALSVSVYEGVAGRVFISHYWIYYHLSRAYFLLGRNDACFLTAAFAIQMEPTFPSWHMYDHMFLYLRNRGLFQEAADIFRHQVAHTPEIPIRSVVELRDVVRQAKLDEIDAEGHDGRYEDHTLVGPSELHVQIAARYGSEGPASWCYALEQLGPCAARPAVVVADIRDAELILFKGNVIVFDSSRVLLADLSVAEFPDILAKKIMTSPDYADMPVVEADVVRVIADRYSTANICHFLLDHVSRLALYDMLVPGVKGPVIGPSLVTDYQKCIVERLKCDEYLGTSQSCLVRSRRLLISRTCKETFSHPAHLGSKWAINYLRQAFLASEPARNGKMKIYVSRRDASHRMVRNESEMLFELEAAGFKAVELGSMDYNRQLELFKESSHVVGMHGAGLTGMVFCQGGAKVLEICHPISGSAGYAVIGSVLDMDYSILVGRDADSDDPHLNDWRHANSGEGLAGSLVASNRDVHVDIGELRRWLRDSGACA